MLKKLTLFAVLLALTGCGGGGDIDPDWNTVVTEFEVRASSVTSGVLRPWGTSSAVVDEEGVYKRVEKGVPAITVPEAFAYHFPPGAEVVMESKAGLTLLEEGLRYGYTVDAYGARQGLAHRSDGSRIQLPVIEEFSATEVLDVMSASALTDPNFVRKPEGLLLLVAYEKTVPENRGGPSAKPWKLVTVQTN